MAEKFIVLAEIFQNHMILQRNRKVRIWGESSKEQVVRVSLDEKEILTAALPKGKFSFYLPELEAAEDVTIRFENEEKEVLSLENVDIGEVWIAGGQSNMEFALCYDKKGDSVISSASDRHFRYYEVGKFAFDGEKEENIKYGAHRWDHWRTFTPEQCTHFSAVATYFAMELREKRKVPVGIIGCAWGGTSASAWMDESILKEDPILHIYTDEYEKAISGLNMDKYLKSDRKNREFLGNQKNVEGQDQVMKNEVLKPLNPLMRVIVRQYVKTQKTGPHSENRPGGLYHTMLSKISGFTASGVIFYQGENDEMHADIYERLFTKMMECWRRDWESELPFLFVQLAPFGQWMVTDGSNFPKLRQEQQATEDHVDDVWMASIMDCGSRYDIHPKDKEPVGLRLAYLALDKIYGEKIDESQAPRIDNVSVNGKELTAHFQFAEKGLKSKGDIASMFRIKQGRETLSASAEIRGKDVILHVPELQDNQPVELSFAYAPYLEMNLYNVQGLAARPMEPLSIG